MLKTNKRAVDYYVNKNIIIHTVYEITYRQIYQL